MTKEIYLSNSYVLLRTEKIEFYVGRNYWDELINLIEQAKKMKKGKLKKVVLGDGHE